MPKKILLVDDEEALCAALSLRLIKRGYFVGYVCDGKRGLEAVEDSAPDMIILDLGLPGVSGEELCKKIREGECDRGTQQPMKIIMLTAKDSEADQIVGHVLGADAYIAKPCDVDLLLDEVEKLLK